MVFHERSSISIHRLDQGGALATQAVTIIDLFTGINFWWIEFPPEVQISGGCVTVVIYLRDMMGCVESLSANAMCKVPSLGGKFRLPLEGGSILANVRKIFTTLISCFARGTMIVSYVFNC